MRFYFRIESVEDFSFLFIFADYFLENIAIGDEFAIFVKQVLDNLQGRFMREIMEGLANSD